MTLKSHEAHQDTPWQDKSCGKTMQATLRTMNLGVSEEEVLLNPNALHDFYIGKRGVRNIPNVIRTKSHDKKQPTDPGHDYAQTKNISFDFFRQRKTNAPFGYDHYISLPPSYSSSASRRWPLILFLHGSGQSQRGTGQSYASLRHGISKIILCYDRLKSGLPPVVDIPLPPRLRKAGNLDRSSTAVDAEVCNLVAEQFITVSPSLNMSLGYGWIPSILAALLDEVVETYSVDVDRVHVTGFSMGGYGTWDLAMKSPHRFASLVSICGGGDVLRAAEIAHVPHWIHHGEKDNIVPLRASTQMVEALEEVNALEVRFTSYPERMHDSWTDAYDNIEVFRWMLEHRRSHCVGRFVAATETDPAAVGSTDAQMVESSMLRDA